MRVSLSVDEFVHDPARHLERVTHRGERLVLSRGDVPVAEVAPPKDTTDEPLHTGDLAEALAALPRLSSTETEAFARDLDAHRRSTPPDSLRNPWAS